MIIQEIEHTIKLVGESDNVIFHFHFDFDTCIARLIIMPEESDIAYGVLESKALRKKDGTTIWVNKKMDEEISLIEEKYINILNKCQNIIKEIYDC